MTKAVLFSFNHLYLDVPSTRPRHASAGAFRIVSPVISPTNLRDGYVPAFCSSFTAVITAAPSRFSRFSLWSA